MNIGKSEIWDQVVAHLNQRRSRLVSQCVSPLASDRERQDCAARIAELDELLLAPKHAAQDAEGKQPSSETY